MYAPALRQLLLLVLSEEIGSSTVGKYVRKVWFGWIIYLSSEAFPIVALLGYVICLSES
jgi:hypothetical protein